MSNMTFFPPKWLHSNAGLRTGFISYLWLNMFHTELFKILIDVFFSGPQRGSREEPRRKTILCINTIRTVSFPCVFLAGLIVYKLCLFVFTLPFQRCVCVWVCSLFWCSLSTGVCRLFTHRQMSWCVLTTVGLIYCTQIPSRLQGCSRDENCLW